MALQETEPASSEKGKKNHSREENIISYKKRVVMLFSPPVVSLCVSHTGSQLLALSLCQRHTSSGGSYFTRQQHRANRTGATEQLDQSTSSASCLINGQYQTTREKNTSNLQAHLCTLPSAYRLQITLWKQGASCGAVRCLITPLP